MVRAAAIVLIEAVAAAQTTAPAPAFEVASVKLDVYRGPGMRLVRGNVLAQFEISGTRVATSGSLLMLVASAYELQRFQVSQSPEWTDKWATTDIYNIEARAPGDGTPTVAQVRQMMQALLAERFQLKVSRQTQAMPVYELVVAPGGPKITPSEFTGPPLTRDEGSAGTQIRTRFVNYSMADFVTRIMPQFDRPLLDKTGLNGGYDFSLEYTAQPPGITAAQAAGLGLPDPEPGLPIIASIRGQLGLRVVPAKEPVETLVIDHAERSSGN